MKNRSVPFSVAMAAALLLAGGCNKKQTEQSAGDGALLGSVKGTAAGAQWTVPKRWSAEGERPMRVATYAVPQADGDTEAGECAVFYFGNDQGGSVDANIDRWISQFENPGVPARKTREVSGMKVTLVQVSGTYLSPGGPMMQSQGKKENYRLYGAIVGAPEGSVFFKMTGPAKTVVAAEPDFDALIGSLTKQQ